MCLKTNRAALPWISAGVGCTGTIVPFFLPQQNLFSLSDAWPTYIFILLIFTSLSYIAYLSWWQQRDSDLPSPKICELLSKLPINSFNGTKSEFNDQARKIIYGDRLSDLILDGEDYYSLMIADELISVSSITDKGNKPDGNPDTTVSLFITQKGTRALHTLSKYH